MKVTKYIHSCLLVEEQGKTILLDPGNYSYEQKVLDINTLSKLDAIGITHEHLDHMYIPWIKEIVAKFPSVQLFSNSSVKEILGKEGIQVSITGNDFLQMTPIQHEKIFGVSNPVQNVQISLFGKFATVGDSLAFGGVPDILALPVQAAWGSTTQCVERAVASKPKIIVPIHDWQWREEHRKAMYVTLEKYFGGFGIRFLKAETGISFEV